jgi:hypothetical protein
MKVVEFFKLYNLALGLNSKTQSLQHYMLNFEQSRILNYPCPYQGDLIKLFDIFANV